jgi:hypothetical protein
LDLEEEREAWAAFCACLVAERVLAKAFCNDLEADLAAALVAADALLLLAEREADRERERREAIYIYT